RDPLDIEAGDPNDYRYGHNDPPNTTDPSGLEDTLTLKGAAIQAVKGFQFLGDVFVDSNEVLVVSALKMSGMYEGLVPRFVQLRSRLDFMKNLREKDQDLADFLSNVRILWREEDNPLGVNLPTSK